MEPHRIQHHARQALDWTGDTIAKYGGRLAGSRACQSAALDLRDRLAAACGGAFLEPFHTRPWAFHGFYRVDCLVYLAGLVLLWLNQPVPAALLLVLMVVAAGLQFGYYRELYDPLYPRRECQNVWAALEPRGEARRHVIISGHHDSAPELSFLKSSQKLYGLKIVVPDLFRIMAAVFAVYWSLHQALAGSAPAVAGSMKVLLALGLYPVFTKFFLFGKEATPGAGDNLIASAMLPELARLFADPDLPGRSTLESTRLVFVSFDAEESGLRGSRAYARSHRVELNALPTFALNIDGIYHVSELKFLVTDLNNHIRLDRALAEDCRAIARELGYEARLFQMIFGGGGTDAAELAKAGVRATTMIAMPSGLVRDGLVYHTLRDTVDAIEPAAVEACLAVAHDFALHVDQENTHEPNPVSPEPVL